MILPDNPIEDKDSDKLRRAPLAAKVGELINDFKGDQSFVIGIEGVWGLGKTSFVNLILKNLDPVKTVVVPFNPWNFSGQNELISDFFSTLASRVDAFKNESDAKKMMNLVSKLTRKSEVTIAPEVSFLGFGLKVGELAKFGGGEKTLQDQRAEIDTIFKSLNKKVVIVIDDIDRLDPVETRLVMKLVKMTANFPNTVFLLAYDRQKVAERLTEVGWEGEDYLKKIVQVSFTLPEPDRQGLNGILFGDLDATIEALYGTVNIEGEDEQRWNKMGFVGFPKLFKTVRDIKRYISSLRLNWSIVGTQDINIIDFICIEAIRVFAPNFYNAIAGNKPLFTGTDDFGFATRDRGAKSAEYQELLKLIPEEIRPIIQGMCKELFLPLDSGYGHDWQQRWRTEKRICAEERFGFYFQLGVPVGAISEAEVGVVLASLDVEGGFEKVLLKFQEEKRLRPLLAKILDVVGKLTKAQVKTLILTLWNLEKTIDEGRVAGFDFDDVETQSMRLSYFAIKNVIPQNERAAFILELLGGCTTLYYPTHFIMALDQELQKSGKPAEEYLVAAASIEEPKRIIAERIKNAAANGALPAEREFAYLLHWWGKWSGDEEEPKQYVAQLLQTRAGLLSYMKAFVQKVFSSTGNYNRMDRKGIVDFIAQDTLDSLISSITPEDLAAMEPKDKEAVELYRNPKRSIFD